MAQSPELELDERWFKVLASSPSAALVQHTQTGTLVLWRLEWKDKGDWPAASNGDAWAAYMKVMNE